MKKLIPVVGMSVLVVVVAKAQDPAKVECTKALESRRGHHAVRMFCRSASAGVSGGVAGHSVADYGAKGGVATAPPLARSSLQPPRRHSALRLRAWVTADRYALDDAALHQELTRRRDLIDRAMRRALCRFNEDLSPPTESLSDTTPATPALHAVPTVSLTTPEDRRLGMGSTIVADYSRVSPSLSSPVVTWYGRHGCLSAWTPGRLGSTVPEGQVPVDRIPGCHLDPGKSVRNGRRGVPAEDGDHDHLSNDKIVHPDEQCSALHGIELGPGGRPQAVVVIAPPPCGVGPEPVVGLCGNLPRRVPLHGA